MDEIALFLATSVVATIAMRSRRQQGLSDSDLLSLAGGRIFKFVLTGGPCGGKTTAIAR